MGVLKVKHAELKQVSSTMQRDSEAIDTEVENMLKQIETLRGIWQGEDATQFCDHANEYITRIKNITVAMRNMQKVMNAANQGYEENDEAFGNALKTEAQNYDEDGGTA